MLQTKGGHIEGLLVSHVDDLLWSGTGRMEEVMARITEAFRFGSLESGSSFDYCGRNIAQTEDGILVTWPVALDPLRRRQRDSPVTEPEREQLRSVVGSLNWLVRVCRMDVAYDVHYLQSIMQKAIVDDLIQCNQVLAYVKRTPHKGLFFKYEAFKDEDLTIYSITDASHAANFDIAKNGEPLGHRSQSGRVLALGPRSLATTGEGHLHVIEYHSTVIRRVCRSTLQAETLSLIAGYEEAEHVRTVIHSMNGGNVRGSLVGAMDATPLVMMTDCRVWNNTSSIPGFTLSTTKGWPLT